MMCPDHLMMNMICEKIMVTMFSAGNKQNHNPSPEFFVLRKRKAIPSLKMEAARFF
jgi:hypothetical protein